MTVKRCDSFDFAAFSPVTELARCKYVGRPKDIIAVGSSGTVKATSVITDLKPILRGWFGYFKQTHPKTFPGIDGFIRQRLRSKLLNQMKKPHFRIVTLFSKVWPNACLTDRRLFTLKTSSVRQVLQIGLD